MAFSSRRGRPRSEAAPAVDLGTPELIRKRALNITHEAIDLCLERELIGADQHWCAIHLRWLYTLRYGAPGVRAVDPTHLGGRETLSDNPEWRREREREYQDAVLMLGNGARANRLLALCVFNQHPRALLHCVRPPSGTERRPVWQREMEDLTEALDVLVRLWCRRKAVDG